MGFLGFFKKGDLEKIKVEDIEREAGEQKRLEQQNSRRMTDLEDQKRTVEDYAQYEKLTESELDQCASQIEDLELEIAAVELEINRIRKNKHTLNGFAMLQRRRDELKKSGVWSTLNAMGSEELEDKLVKLGELDAKTASNMDKLRDTLGIPTTKRDARASMSARRREILEDLKRKRSQNLDEA